MSLKEMIEDGVSAWEERLNRTARTMLMLFIRKLLFCFV